MPPTTSPTTESPTTSPSVSPPKDSTTVSPTTASPTGSPTTSPNTVSRTESPTTSPTTWSPTTSPTTVSPTVSPTEHPTPSPTAPAPPSLFYYPNDDDATFQLQCPAGSSDVYMVECAAWYVASPCPGGLTHGRWKRPCLQTPDATRFQSIPYRAYLATQCYAPAPIVARYTTQARSPRHSLLHRLSPVKPTPPLRCFEGTRDPLCHTSHTQLPHRHDTLPLHAHTSSLSLHVCSPPPHQVRV